MKQKQGSPEKQMPPTPPQPPPPDTDSVDKRLECRSTVRIVEQGVTDLLLSRYGDNLVDIAKKSGANVELDHATKDKGYSIVVLSGNGMEQAEDMIDAVVGEEAERRRAEGLQTWYVDVPSDMVGLLIGSKGATIRELQHKALGTKIVVERSAGSEGQAVIGPDTPEQLAIAKKLVQDKVEEFRKYREDNKRMKYGRVGRGDPGAVIPGMDSSAYMGMDWMLGAGMDPMATMIPMMPMVPPYPMRGMPMHSSNAPGVAPIEDRDSSSSYSGRSEARSDDESSSYSGNEKGNIDIEEL